MFQRKKITVVGLGLLGRGAGDAEFLARHGAEVLVTDLKTEEELAPSVERLQHFSNVTFVLGEHREEDFVGRDFILRGPTVPADSPFLERARKEGIPIKMSASWFAELAGIPVVGVTGTRGKTTTTFMLKEILEAAGRRVMLGGNIRGVSTLALLPDVTKDSIALMELDSWQCRGFGEAGLSPNIAVFTTLYSDHMNYYQGNMQRYLDDKAQIFLHQKPKDVFILGVQARQAVLSAYTPPVTPSIADVSAIDGWEIGVPGEHNRSNAACAALSAQALGIDEVTCKRALREFRGVPGRLELVREVNGVRFYNDTTATIPEATIAALEALFEKYGHGVSIILIMGGADKGLDMAGLIEALSVHTKEVVYLAGSGTERLGVTGAHASLGSAVAAAVAAATEGDIILFSPAFASFGMFKNEYDRGDQFNALVSNL